MKLTLLCGSLRKESYNRKLISVVRSVLKQQPGMVTFDEIESDAMRFPLYDGDLEDSSGIPAAVQKLGTRIEATDALIIASPEYNGAISSVLKTTVDWLSRLETNPLEEKPILLLSATPGPMNGIRGLWHTRVPLEAMGCFVYPQMLGLGKAGQAFAPDGSLTDAKTSERLTALVSEYLAWAGRLAAPSAATSRA